MLGLTQNTSKDSSEDFYFTLVSLARVRCSGYNAGYMGTLDPNITGGFTLFQREEHFKLVLIGGLRLNTEETADRKQEVFAPVSAPAAAVNEDAASSSATSTRGPFPVRSSEKISLSPTSAR